MTRPRSAFARSLSALAAASIAATGLAVMGASPAVAAPAVVYDSRPDVPASAYASLGFQATQTSQFGDLVQLAGENRRITEVTVNLTSWACEAGGWNTLDCATTEGLTFTHPITLNLYEVDRSGVDVAAGALIESTTVSMEIPYRPSASPNCVDGDAGKWEDTAGGCFNGIAADVSFSGLDVLVGDEVIIGIAYNTQSYGDAPVGVTGPYDSLNVSLSPEAPTVGTDENADEVFWQTTYPGYDGTWAVDSGWGDFNGLVMSITADGEPEPLPEPEPELADTGAADAIGPVLLGGMGIVALGVLLALLAQRRRNSAAEVGAL